MNNIQDQPCAIRVLHCGGTIRSCQTAAIKYDQQLLLLLKDASARTTAATATTDVSAAMDEDADNIADVRSLTFFLFFLQFAYVFLSSL